MKLEYQHNGIYCKDIAESIKFYEGTLGFKLLFSTEAMEGDKPLKMAWIRNEAGVVIELLEQWDKAPLDSTKGSLNHLALRVDDMDAFVAHLNEKGIAIEAGPFATGLEFDRELSDEETAIFAKSSSKGLALKIMFFRGPGNERFEVVQDNIAAL